MVMHSPNQTNRSVCVICGKVHRNTLEDSVRVDICMKKYATFSHKESKQAPLGSSYTKTPRYAYKIVIIEKRPIAIVIDEGEECDCPSVTNAIELVADELKVYDIVYRDSLGTWDYWSKTNGFYPLGKDGEAVKDMDLAIARTKKRYLKA